MHAANFFLWPKSLMSTFLITGNRSLSIVCILNKTVNVLGVLAALYVKLYAVHVLIFLFSAVVFLYLSPVPDHPPSNVTAYNTSSTSINVTWQPIPPDHLNGILLGYHVRYWRADKPNDNISVAVANRTVLNTELTGLGKYKLYSIQVAGRTVAGVGNFSNPVFVRTEQDGRSCIVHCSWMLKIFKDRDTDSRIIVLLQDHQIQRLLLNFGYILNKTFSSRRKLLATSVRQASEKARSSIIEIKKLIIFNERF